MKASPFLTATALSIASVLAQESLMVDIVGSAANHQLNWNPACVNYNYSVEMSPDLQGWADIGLNLPGNNGTLSIQGTCNTSKCFYRVLEVIDPNYNFLVSPSENQIFNIDDGVAIGFDISGLKILKEIRISTRTFDTGASWNRIGLITAFDERRGVRFVRGGTAWVPENTGTFEMMAEVVNSSGGVVGTAVRKFTVIPNNRPTITINGPLNFPNPSTDDEIARFDVTVLDSDPGDTISRVDYFSNGVYIGQDVELPFEEGRVSTIYDSQVWLRRGTHSIKAIAYDNHGKASLESSALNVITGANTMPRLTSSFTDGSFDLTQGDLLRVDFFPTFPGMTEEDEDVEGLFFVTLRDPASGQNFGDIDIVAEPTMSFFDVNTLAFEPGEHRLQLVAEFIDKSHPHYFTVNVRESGPTSFVETLTSLLCDPVTATPSNARLIGRGSASDTFQFGLTAGLEMSDGALFTTGNGASWNSGDGSEQTTTQHDRLGDNDLTDRILKVPTLDPSGIEFDVFCVNGQLEFEFQIGSEEYIEALIPVGSSVINCLSDACLITVDGAIVNLLPDANGSTNSDIVNINTVYPEILAADSMCSGNQSFSALNEHLYLDDSEIPGGIEKVEYDGMTICLRAHALVTPGKTHRVKIVIAEPDNNFDGRDSAIFIEAGSIRTVNPGSTN